MKGMWCAALWSVTGIIAVSGALVAVGSSAASAASTTKQPIVVGFLGGDQYLGDAHFDATASAAAAYENSIGGIHGHPLKLVVCDDDGTPESVTGCANTFISDHVSAVGTTITANESSILTPLTAVNIPLIDNAPISLADFSPDVIGQTGAALFGLLAPAVYGQEHGLNSSAMLLVNSSSSAATAGLSKLFYGKANVSYTDELVDQGSADLTAPVETATSGNPKSMDLLLGGASQTADALKAAQTLGYKGQIFLAGTASPQLVQAAGSAVNGVISSQFTTSALSKPDLATYTAAMKKYDKGVSPDYPEVDSVFSNVSLIAAGLRTMPASSTFTGAQTLAAFKALKNFTYFMDFGIPLTCNGTAVKFTPSLCESKGPLVKYKNGKLVSAGVLDFHQIANVAAPT